MCGYKNNYRMIIIFIFVVFMFGCSEKYVASREGELFGREWCILNTEIIEQDDEGFTLNLNVKDFVSFGKIYKQGFKEKDGSEHGESLIGFPEIIVGSVFLFHSIYFGRVLKYLSGDEQGGNLWWYTAGCTLGGLFLIAALSSQSRKSDETKLPYVPIDKMCVDSVSLLRQKVMILIEESHFEEIYWTDEEGNIELKFNEVIPEPAEADSILNLIIQYEKMFDTVKVRRL